MIYFENGKAKIRTAEIHDICLMKDRLRPECKMEIEGASGISPERMLLLSYLNSEEPLAFELDGVPETLFGLVPPRAPGEPATVWVLTTEKILSDPKTFLVLSRRVIRAFLQRYPICSNWVDVRFEASVKWALWLGAELGDPEPHGPEGLPFRRVVFRREDQ